MTWLTEWGHLCTHRFLLGGGLSTRRGGYPEELCLAVPDGYDSVAYKVHAGMRYALASGYEHVFYSDTDTYVCVPHLLASDYARAPYIGLRCCEGHASGGAGFWVNGPGIAALAEAPPQHGFSDMWVRNHLDKAGIKLTHDGRYYGSPPVEFPSDLISMHTIGSIGTMYRAHARYKDAK